MVSGSHKNYFWDLEAQHISRRSPQWIPATKMVCDGWLSRKCCFREARFVRGLSWELTVMDHFRVGFGYFHDYFRLSRNLSIFWKWCLGKETKPPPCRIIQKSDPWQELISHPSSWEQQIIVASEMPREISETSLRYPTTNNILSYRTMEYINLLWFIIHRTPSILKYKLF